MAEEIARPKVIGNFKPSQEEQLRAKKSRVSFRAQRPGMSADHLDLIRKLPCCVCGMNPGGEAHHLKDTPDKERGMSLTSTDKWTVPMCHSDHIYGVEKAGSRNELKWFADRGVMALSLAVSLWGASGNLDKMKRVLIAHRGSAWKAGH